MNHALLCFNRATSYKVATIGITHLIFFVDNRQQQQKVHQKPEPWSSLVMMMMTNSYHGKVTYNSTSTFGGWSYDSLDYSFVFNRQLPGRIGPGISATNLGILEPRAPSSVFFISFITTHDLKKLLPELNRQLIISGPDGQRQLTLLLVETLNLFLKTRSHGSLQSTVEHPLIGERFFNGGGVAVPQSELRPRITSTFYFNEVLQVISGFWVQTQIL